MRGLLLGFDGVLVDDRQTHVELLCQVLGEEGLDVAPSEAARFLAGGESALELDHGILRGALEAAGQTSAPALVPRLAARKAAYYQMRLREEGHRAVDAGVALVEQAAEAGWMLGLVTATSRSVVESALDQLGLAQRFKSIVAGKSENGDATQGYVHAFRELNALPPLPTRLLHPHEVAVIDVEPAQLQAAAEAGFMIAGLATRQPVERFTTADAVLHEPADLELRRLGDLLRAG